MEDFPEASGAPSHGEVGFSVFEDDRQDPPLPLADLLTDPLAQDWRIERAAIEEHGLDRRTILQEIREVTGDGAVGSVRKSPFPQRRLRLPGAIVRITFGEEAIQEDVFDLRTGNLADSEPAMKLDPRPGMETGKVWAGSFPPSAPSLRSRHRATRWSHCAPDSLPSLASRDSSRWAMARSILSPPSRIWSLTATRLMSGRHSVP